MKAVNVVLHKFIPPYDTVIKRILQEKISKVSITIYNYNITRDDCVDLLICYFNEKNENDQQLWDLLTELKEKNAFPVVLIAQNTSEIYYKMLIKTGLYNSITIPCSKSFIYKIIDGVIMQASSLEKEKQLICDVDFISEQFAVNNENLAQFISLIIENLIHHGDLLQKRVAKSICFYENKQFGVIIEDEDNDEIQLSSEKELWNGLDNCEFELYYQPVFCMKSDRITGFESLIRWNHPQKGLLSPDDFIPLAEQSEVIFPLGLWLIEEASKQAHYWNEMFKTASPLKVNINLSAKQFVNQSLADQIATLVEKNKVDPQSIVFEITESAFMSDMEAANLILLELRAQKFQVYLDDFGTGYSSLSYLMHFPVDVLKIDKSFVRWMHIDEQSLEIVKSVIALAHNLNMKVVAEGVEEEEHIAMLKDFGCDFGQGYYFAKPLRAADAEELLKKAFGL